MKNLSKTSLRLLIILAISTFIYSCEKEEESIDHPYTQTLSLEASNSNELTSSGCFLNGPTIANIGGYDDYEWFNQPSLFIYPVSDTGWIHGNLYGNQVTRLHPTEEFTCGYLRVRNNNCQKVLIVKAPGITDCQCQEELAPFLDDSNTITATTFLRIERKSGACAGDIYTYEAITDNGYDNDEDSYIWTTHLGASIISGQGTSRVRIQSPPSGNFYISLTYTNSCTNVRFTETELGEFDSNCNTSGPILSGF